MTVIEVGVWKGLSTSHLANWLKKRGKGVMVSIDTWLGAPEFWGAGPMSGGDQTRSLEINFGLPHVYYTFLSNIVHQGLEAAVIPLPLPSKLATIVINAAGLYGAVDLVHVSTHSAGFSRRGGRGGEGLAAAVAGAQAEARRRAMPGPAIRCERPAVCPRPPAHPPTCRSTRRTSTAPAARTSTSGGRLCGSGASSWATTITPAGRAWTRPSTSLRCSAR